MALGTSLTGPQVLDSGPVRTLRPARQQWCRSGLQPVFQRELRVAARRRDTWRLRLGFAVAASLAVIFAMCLPDVSPGERGRTVLICLATCGFVFCLFSGAYLTADSVSLEKREGTLGLLFLTPLTGWQIVLGKLLTHSLQVGYAQMGAFPLFFLPILLGGVVSDEVIRVLVVLLTTLLLSIACGLVWSTFALDARTTVLGTAISMVLLTLLPWLWIWTRWIATGDPPTPGVANVISPLTSLVFAFEAAIRGAGPFGPMTGRSMFHCSLAVNLLMSTAAILLCGGVLPRVWQSTEGGVQRRSAKGTFIQAAGRRSRGRIGIMKAPLALVWLASRDLREPRWLKWVNRAGILLFLFFLLACATSTAVDAFLCALLTAYALHFIARVHWTLAATRRLHADRRSGALETVLTTPVTDAALVRAHHQSLKNAFRRSLWVLLMLNIALLLTTLLLFEHLDMDGGPGAVFSALFLGGALLAPADFAAMRWLALREALTRQTHLKAAFHVFVRLQGVSWVAFAAAFLLAIANDDGHMAGIIFAAWAAACLACDYLLIRRCQQWIAGGFRARATAAVRPVVAGAGVDG